MTLDLDAIKARVAAATPGPWEWVCEAHCGVEHRSQEIPACRNAQYDWFALRSNDAPVLEHWATYADDSGLSVGPADATFIARARADIPALIAEVEALRGALAKILSCTATSASPTYGTPGSAMYDASRSLLKTAQFSDAAALIGFPLDPPA